MNIGEAARRSGVPAKTIRYYDSIGLIHPVRRTGAGYRVYDDATVHTLRFVARARQLGFTVEQVGRLLELWRDRNRASADVKGLAQQHLAEIDRRIADLQAMRETLNTLIEHCHGDARPECPILEELAGDDVEAPTDAAADA